MLGVAVILALIAKILMFRDALRRGVPTFWLWVIAFMPLGEVAYFFLYPFEDRRLRKKLFGAFGPSRPSRHDAARVAEKMDRATRRYDAGDFAAAEIDLESVLHHSGHHKEALYLLGMSRMQQEDFAGAIHPFERLVDIKGGYRDYGAWLMLSRAQEEDGDLKAAIATLERLVERSPKLRHLVLLAELAVKAGDRKKARTVLSHTRAREGEPEWQNRRDRLDARLDEEA